MASDELFSPEIAELENFIDSYVGNNRTLSSSSLSQSPTKPSGFGHRTSSSDSKDSHLDRVSSTESRGSTGRYNGNKEKVDFLSSFQDELLLHQRGQNLNYENKINSALMSMQYQPAQNSYNENDLNSTTQALAMQLRAARENYENEIRPHIQIQENRGMNSYYQQQQHVQSSIPQQQFSPVQWEQQQMYYQPYPLSEEIAQQQPIDATMSAWNQQQPQQLYKSINNTQQYISPGLHQMYPEATTFPSVTMATMPIANGPQQQQMSFPEWVDVSKPPPMMWNQQAQQQQAYSAPAQNYQPTFTPPLADNANYSQVSPNQSISRDSGISSPNTPQTQSQSFTNIKQNSPTAKTKSSPTSVITQQLPNAGNYQSRVFKRSTSSSSNTSTNHQRKSSSGRFSIGEADRDENWRETCKQNRQMMNGEESQKDDQSSVFSDKSDKSEKATRRHNKAQKSISNSDSIQSNESQNNANPKTISARSKANIKSILGGNNTNSNSRKRDNGLNDKMHAMSLSTNEEELNKFIETAQSYSTNEAKMLEVAEIVCNKAIQNPMFGRKAALLCKRMSSYMTQGNKFRSVVLNIMQGHYRNCQQFLTSFLSSNGKDIRLLGYMTFLAEFFVNVTTKSGEHLKVLTEPLYKCLMIVIVSPNLNRPLVDCFTSTLELSGKLLERFNPKKMSNLMSEVRNQCIVSPNFPKILKRELLRSVEVYSSNWSSLRKATQQYYEIKVNNDIKEHKSNHQHHNKSHSSTTSQKKEK